MEPLEDRAEPMETQVHMEQPAVACGPLPRPSGASDETVIAGGMTLAGDLYGSGTLWVRGTVKGNAKLTGTVVITETGVVEGAISADVVYVAGYVEGNIFAKDLLKLEMTGDINGDVKTASFQIKDGGCLNGFCTMTKAGQEPVFLY